MNVSLIQTRLHWELCEKNMEHFRFMIEQIRDTDLIVLPEMFSTGFTRPSDKLAAQMDQGIIAELHELAKSKNTVICGSLMVKESGGYVNRLLWFSPEKSIQYYDKRHLFRMAGEHEDFDAGRKRVIVEYKGFRILLQICYDLRFPVFSRNRYKASDYEYDLLLYVANWPSPRHTAWETLLRARAIENLSYCIGVNRVGEDGNSLQYNGGSAIIGPRGETIAEAGNRERIIQADISLENLRAYRTKFPAGLDADAFQLMD